MNKKTKITLLVFAVIIFLALALIPKRVTSRKFAETHAKPLGTKARIISLNMAIDMYKMDTAIYPDQGLGLESLINDFGVKDWNGPYLEQSTLPTDHWGNPFEYKLIRNIPIVISSGADGKFGTYDDIETGLR